jgi:hypothetical protein
MIPQIRVDVFSYRDYLLAAHRAKVFCAEDYGRQKRKLGGEVCFLLQGKFGLHGAGDVKGKGWRKGR